MKLKLLLFTVILFYSTKSNAQWQQDFLLTNNSGGSSSNRSGMVAVGNTLHVVWDDDVAGNNEIFYKQSTDEGATWSVDTRLTYDSASGFASAIAGEGNNIHVVWMDNRDGNYEVYYKQSTDGGISWGQDTRLTNDTNDSNNPSISISGMNLFITWWDNRNGNNEIYFKRSTDGGLTWGLDERLTNNTTESFEPYITSSDSTVRIVWTDQRNGINGEVYYKISTDYGISWGPDIRLTQNGANSGGPVLAVSGLDEHLVWFDTRDGNYEIYYKNSLDGGLTWGTDTRLTDNPETQFSPNIIVSGQNIHVFWRDDRNNFEIYYRRSTDGGMSWENETRLTNDSAYSDHPSGAVTGDIVHVIWTDARSGNGDIYYNRNSTANNIGLANLELTHAINIFPDPASDFFNITLNGSLPLKEYHLGIFNMLGENIFPERLFLQSQIINCASWASGIYFVMVTDGVTQFTKKIIIR